MKKMLFMLLLVTLATGVVWAEDSFKSDQEKVGYAIGMNIGMNMKQQQVDVDAAQVAAGLAAAFNGDKTLLSVEEMAQVLTAYQQEMQMKQMAEMAAEAEKNLKLADEFLTANAKQDGVVTLESGLQYRIISSCTVDSPGVDATVQVHYRGTLIDGTEFDSSYQRGEPVSFPVNGVIPGWTEALQLMKEGDKWQLVIPPQLAYAERGAPPVIPPNSALIFEVELLKIL